jgi:RimJ/RimL family protein N-acetyltransferase
MRDHHGGWRSHVTTEIPVELRIRELTRFSGVSDFFRVLALGRRTLGWLDDEAELEFFRWKHLQNPFGASPMWVAETGGRVVGFRTFMRWELLTPSGAVRRVVRAVDTATDPDYHGRGIFTTLTRAALDALHVDGVDFVFNTPNEQSRPGYLKMGWQQVGRLPISVRATRVGSVATLIRARMPASRSAVGVNVGVSAASAFADAKVLARVLADAPPARRISTNRRPDYYAWRYGFAPLHYRAVTTATGLAGGFAVFHLRRRGTALEAAVCDVVVPGGEPRVERELLGRIARETGADYVVRLGGAAVGRDGFVRIPRAGPILTVREVSTSPPVHRRDWELGMGEIELF